MEERIKRVESKMPSDKDIVKFEERIRLLESKLQSIEEN